MAIRKNSALGHVTGKFGNTITRYRNGRYVVYKKPESVNFSSSEAAVSTRLKFAYTVKFAKLINSNKELKEVWNSAKLKGINAYQNLIKYNSKTISSAGLSLNSIITPDGFPVFSPELIFDLDKIIVKARIDFPPHKLPASFFLLFNLYSKKDNELFLLSSQNITTEKTGFLMGSIYPSEEEKQIIKKYDNALLFVTFTFSRNKIREIFWSSSQSFSLSISLQ